MPARILLRCPGCRARIKAPFALLGARRHCPGCGAAFMVRGQPLEDSSPLLVLMQRATARDGQQGRP